MSKPSVVRMKSRPSETVWEDNRSAVCRATDKCIVDKKRNER